VNSTFFRTIPSALLAAALCSACTGATAGGGVQSPATAAAGAPATPRYAADSGGYPFTDADVHFMTGMIPHHAQALVMARMAPSHGANDAIQRMAERIIVAQGDEIATMRTWLADRGQPVPPADATHMTMNMGGMQHDMLMPGMLTPAQLAQLDAARGVEFDRLFLTFMIQHHQGAVGMVDELMASPGAAQDEVVFRFSADVYADQTSEIARMQSMLDALPAGGQSLQ
jgi:uncharacterized protein (DUF305 family)